MMKLGMGSSLPEGVTEFSIGNGVEKLTIRRAKGGKGKTQGKAMPSSPFPSPFPDPGMASMPLETVDERRMYGAPGGAGDEGPHGAPVFDVPPSLNASLNPMVGVMGDGGPMVAPSLPTPYGLPVPGPMPGTERLVPGGGIDESGSENIRERLIQASIAQTGNVPTPVPDPNVGPASYQDIAGLMQGIPAGVGEAPMGQAPWATPLGARQMNDAAIRRAVTPPDVRAYYDELRAPIGPQPPPYPTPIPAQEPLGPADLIEEIPSTSGRTNVPGGGERGDVAQGSPAITTPDTAATALATQEQNVAQVRQYAATRRQEILNSFRQYTGEDRTRREQAANQMLSRIEGLYNQRMAQSNAMMAGAAIGMLISAVRGNERGLAAAMQYMNAANETANGATDLYARAIGGAADLTLSGDPTASNWADMIGTATDLSDLDALFPGTRDEKPMSLTQVQAATAQELMAQGVAPEEAIARAQGRTGAGAPSGSSGSGGSGGGMTWSSLRDAASPPSMVSDEGGDLSRNAAFLEDNPDVRLRPEAEAAMAQQARRVVRDMSLPGSQPEQDALRGAMLAMITEGWLGDPSLLVDKIAALPADRRTAVIQGITTAMGRRNTNPDQAKVDSLAILSSLGVY